VTTFLIVCAVMIVAALALLLVPLLRNVPAAAKGEKPLPRAVPAAVVLMVALPLLASAFYGSTSNFPWDSPGAAAGQGGHAQNAGSMDEVTAQLQARLQQNPGDVEGWMMLGRTHLMSGRYDQAVAAYEKASSLTGGKDPAVQLDLAEALVVSEKPDAQGRAKQILDAALAADGTNQKALWYSGVMAARAGESEAAKTLFTKLLEQNPPEQIRQILIAQLAELGAPVPEAAGAAAPQGMGGMGAAQGASEPAGRTIRIAVSVDPALAGKLRPGTPVFVSAREPGIPGPPIAAVRISTDDLPTTVVLSDANSMIEGRTLSSVDEVQVVARVAFGGSAVPASGDLVGEARHGKGAAPDLSLVISKVAP
jgi:cytochrome c-type biogenesis protein CcmH